MDIAIEVTELTIVVVATVVTIVTVGIVVNVVTKLTVKNLLKNTNAFPLLPVWFGLVSGQRVGTSGFDGDA